MSTNMMKITIVNWSPLKRHYENVAENKF